VEGNHLLEVTAHIIAFFIIVILILLWQHFLNGMSSRP
jgi:hypothetical protein